MSDKFNHQERDHLEVLHRRLEHIAHSTTDRVIGEPGEANALAWALATLEGTVDPVELRQEKLERRLRKLETSMGRVQQWIKEVDEEAREEDEVTA
jgi:hypothetical protein